MSIKLSISKPDMVVLLNEQAEVHERKAAYWLERAAVAEKHKQTVEEEAEDLLSISNTVGYGKAEVFSTKSKADNHLKVAADLKFIAAHLSDVEGSYTLPELADLGILKSMWPDRRSQ
jgi:hypothetical protein